MIKMKKINIILLIMLSLVLPVVLAGLSDEDIRFVAIQNEPLDVKEQCFNNNTYCSATSECNITVKNPTQTILVNNQIMTNQNSFHNYTLNIANTTSVGVYESTIICIDGTDKGYDTFNFKITSDGTLQSIAKSVMYIALLFIVVILFLICVYFTFNLDGKNIYDVGGEVLKVNIMKYVKFGLFFVSYLFFIFITYLCWLISDQYIGAASWFTMIFDNLHFFAWVFLFPIFFFGCILTIIKAFLDMQIYEAAKRGIPPRP